MADIEHVSVAGQVYNIRVPDGSSLSLSSLNVTGTITGAGLNLGSGTITAGPANLASVSCSGLVRADTAIFNQLYTKENIVLRHDSRDVSITWKGIQDGSGQILWSITNIRGGSSPLCSYKVLSSTFAPDHILPLNNVLKVEGSRNNRHIYVDYDALKKEGASIFTPPTSLPPGNGITVKTETAYFDYILFGVEIIS